MGTAAEFPNNPAWNQAAELLDQTFPLATGSHQDVTAYLVYFEHLLAIQADGNTSGLLQPTQFVKCQGSHENPLAIVLEHDGMQVEIEPASCRSRSAAPAAEHRMQLLTTISVTQ